MNTLVEDLKKHRLKVTPQRLAIYEMLSNTRQHPSAESIYRALCETHPSMSLATVYKTLDTLKNTGLIQEINVGEDSFRYDANRRPHPHIICVSCHSVHDLPMFDALERLREEARAVTDFEELTEQLYFYGICPMCQNMAEFRASV
ncbi:MAG: transcriptional repressor [Clostridiales bacterium]|jgi:Fur family peroxide stress response transcriptional regulator|nr:transcriptional repressor [Clostridiales bacterium]